MGAIFLSIKQLFLAEKNNCLDLLQQQVILNAANLEDLPLLTQKETGSVNAEQSEWLKTFFNLLSIDEVAEEDSSTTRLVSGFIGRKEKMLFARRY